MITEEANVFNKKSIIATEQNSSIDQMYRLIAAHVSSETSFTLSEALTFSHSAVSLMFCLSQ